MRSKLMQCTNCDVTEELSVGPNTEKTVDMCIACMERNEFVEVNA